MLSFSMSCYIPSRGAIKTVQTNSFGTTYFPEYFLKILLETRSYGITIIPLGCYMATQIWNTFLLFCHSNWTIRQWIQLINNVTHLYKSTIAIAHVYYSFYLCLFSSKTYFVAQSLSLSDYSILFPILQFCLLFAIHSNDVFLFILADYELLQFFLIIYTQNI